MPRTKSTKKSRIIASLLTESLVEISGLNSIEKQVIFDNANPKLVWVKTESHRPGYIPTYTSKVPRFSDVRIQRAEYNRLVESNLIPDYLYNE